MAEALVRLGHDAQKFEWHQYFSKAGGLNGIWKRVQRKFCTGPLIRRLNRDLYEKVYSFSPDILFVYRGDLIFPETLLHLKKDYPNLFLIGYNNDDPFSPDYPEYIWRHFISGIPIYDLVLAYRSHNLSEFAAAGAKQVRLFRSWFNPSRNYPLSSTVEKDAEVVFVGHYENDGRVACLEAIARQGIDLKIYGPGYDWDPVLEKSELLRHLVPVNLVWGDEYNEALCKAKVALCFFSSLNRDTYTRRCFEIPATGTPLLCQYSADMETMFIPDKEAVYFSNSEELVRKLLWLLADVDARQTIGAAGNEKAWSSGHDVDSRMRLLLDWIKELTGRTEIEDTALHH